MSHTQKADKREIILLCVNSSVMFISFLVLIYINFNRAYIPLKCKNIRLINVLYVSIFCWYVGDIYTYLPTLVPISQPICLATSAWLRISVGAYTLIGCHLFRIYQYHSIFQWHRRAKGWYLWVPIALCAFAPITYGLLASILPESQSISFDLDPAMCSAAKPIYFAAFGFLLTLILCWIYATLLMKYVNVCFSEYRELLVVTISCILVLILQVVLRWVPGFDGTGIGYSIVTSVTDLFIGQVSFYSIIWRPTYHCLVDRDEYLIYFLRTLERQNRMAEYELANGAVFMSNYNGTVDVDVAYSIAGSTKDLVKMVRPSDKNSIYNVDDGYYEDIEHGIPPGRKLV
ncbi:hypothetical protein BX661DRAFT_180689 [Kickxella alabastrina]|uniref:uncharacterized protein n=1 Tax=Kickxella alabastrina TaxID=61397 RepID=UPI00221FAABF|nr:uncharacterized protein BX661DRAFT_180689 [Kickxella alabastrina]KAI7829893.1 hypothetical protein BX661DRAFT_180689 [Kickxella alabastrina]